MEKKKDETTPKRDESADPHKGFQINLRVEDPNLVEALKAYAKSVRRSRNQSIVLLLEEILQQKGFWPWPPERES